MNNTAGTDYRMPFGRFRGQRLDELSDSYIGWLRSLPDLREPLRGAVDQEYRQRINWDTGSRYRWRRYSSNPDDDSDDEDPDQEVPARAKELIEVGFKVLAKRDHPDVGGSTDSMRELLTARLWLLQKIEVLEER